MIQRKKTQVVRKNMISKIIRLLCLSVCLVSNLLNHNFQFKSLICNAYTGDLPPACLTSQKAEPVKPDRCDKAKAV